MAFSSCLPNKNVTVSLSLYIVLLYVCVFDCVCSVIHICVYIKNAQEPVLANSLC